MTMADTLTKEERSKRMSLIRSKNTTIEVKVRRYLFAKGYRFRINDKRYPGHPDIVLPKYKTIVFIHGCFWHSHPNCKVAHIPKSNSDFWIEKFKRNIDNDEKKKAILESQGWRVITLWECEINGNFENTMLALLEVLQERPG
jgi:DNA mismatch endonuclease (patch repair protein)